MEYKKRKELKIAAEPVSGSGIASKTASSEALYSDQPQKFGTRSASGLWSPNQQVDKKAVGMVRV